MHLFNPGLSWLAEAGAAIVYIRHAKFGYCFVRSRGNISRALYDAIMPGIDVICNFKAFTPARC